MSKHYRAENNCLNCGNVVTGKFCSNCGQENIDIREPFWTFVSHGIGHYFHYDSKFKKTLKPFLTKPGQLTKDHMEGRRASHIPPISLYLFITIVYFLCVPIFKEKKESITKINKRYNIETGEISTSISKGSEEFDEDSLLNALENQSLKPQHTDDTKLDSEYLVESDTAKDETIEKEVNSQLQKLSPNKADSTVESYRKRQAALKKHEKDSWLITFWKERKIGYREKTGQEFNLQQLMDKYYPKLLFVMMPLFAFFLMLNFRKNKKLYMEHLIYTIHLFSFAFLSLLVSEFLIYLTPPDTGAVISLIFFGILIWYTYRSIRVVYERSRWVTIRKLFSVSILFLIASIITYVLGMITVVVFS